MRTALVAFICLSEGTRTYGHNDVPIIAGDFDVPWAHQDGRSESNWVVLEG